MAWFSKKNPVAVVEPEVTATTNQKKKSPAGPRLAVLTPDIAGISSFRLQIQDDAAEAEVTVSRLRADVRRGTHAFWAMHDRPDVDESMHVEALVLIRAKAESDLVYVVSFLDLESALSFTRFELRRGLYIGNVMIYWAAFTQIREELEGVSILPSVAPPGIQEQLAPEPPLAPPLPAPHLSAVEEASVAIAPPIAEPETELESIAEAEPLQAAGRYLEENLVSAGEPVAEQPPVVEDSVAVIESPVIEEAPAPVIEPPVFDDEPVTEEAAVADALVLQHPPVVGAVPELAAEIAEPDPDIIAQRRPAPFTPKRRWSIREERLRPAAEEQPEVVAQTSLEVVIEMPEVFVEEPTEELVAEAVQPQEVIAAQEPAIVAGAPEIIAVEDPHANGHAPESHLAPGESEALQAFADRITTYAGDEEADVGDPFDQVEARGPAVDPANGLPQSEKYTDFDIALEVERLLKNRKWESREGPFRGFKSPPGRF